MKDSAAYFDIDLDHGVLRLMAGGDWRARFLKEIDSRLRDFADDSVGRELIIDVSGVKRLDTAGAMVLQRTFYACDSRTERSKFVGAHENHRALLEQVQHHLAPCHVAPLHPNAYLAALRRLGEGVVNAYNAALHLLSFIGETISTWFRLAARPGRRVPPSVPRPPH